MVKYYTFELWGDQSPEAEKQWLRNDKAYYERVKFLKKRISDEAYKILVEKGFHDYTLNELKVIQEGYDFRKWKIKVEMVVTNEIEIWKIKVENVKKIFINHNGTSDDTGFDDWGYEELLDVDESTLSFEILFASGSTILLHFPNNNIFVKQIK
ncbi:hypothetical protein GFC29_97 [Anoxybacillus sp. B7M1]|uniref:hypothetical protein n=1 Tax=Anoxybacillus sp. B7M1 TaxID=1490057 RepID=UPI0007B5EA0F|nr:hypothetical protein [Anoxybacillus sp. B7M1]ANB55579.1 hypothetical protein GFC28_1531 [Anoxybacillus sp. B2M1]ANB63414.1 hypothetical protein GFC29_97 [Anoxybacillus sp. B7M1]